MENNPVYDKLKTEILKEVQPLIDARETARQRAVEIRKQINEYKAKALELKAELRKLDGDYTKALIDSPADAPAIQKKIQKGLQAAKDADDAADRLEGQLQPIDAAMRNRENAVSVAVSQKVLAASREYSEQAGRQFLDLFWTFHKWVQAVIQLRSDLKATGLDGLHSHRLHVNKAVQSLPPDIRIFWHRFVKNIEGDFGSFGSHAGDL